MTFYFKRGNTYNVTANGQMDIQEILPVGTYTVKFNMMEGVYYLEQVSDFDAPSKIYGNTVQVADRILNTFDTRPNATGVMLSGEQGSGKTLQSEIISINARERGIPTFVINSALYGEGFNTFMQSIEQPVVVLFDEFEKVYDDDEQQALLTLLDGVYPTKKLFVLTCNDKYRVNKHMKNRPGRIFYHLEYTGLDVEFVREYCQDNLIEKGHIEGVERLSMLFAEFNFDMLKALVEEMNRYNETPQEALKMLNAKPDNSENQIFDFTLEVAGKVLSDEKLYDTRWRGNPLQAKILINHMTDEKDEDGDFVFDTIEFTPANLVNVDAQSGTFMFTNEDGAKLSLKKQIAVGYNYDLLY